MGDAVKQTVSNFISTKLRRRRNPSGALSKKLGYKVIKNDAPTQLSVRLLDPPSRLPLTPIEKLTVITLEKQGPTPFPVLVKRVAHEIYSDEIRNGAWVMDIGLFGPGLFAPDVVGELEAGNGILWEIKKLQGANDGLLSDFC